ncbi:MAG: M23 family metallopeptidase [Clostridia bacterium]|nr:M23 family metallopeptidase [Clostridia bacterium]
MQRWQKKITTKKVATALVILFLCILPFLLASLYFYYYDYIDHSNQFSVTLYDKNGVELVTEEGNPEHATLGSMVDLFYQLNTKKLPLAKIPNPSDDDDFIVAKLSLNGVSSELQCYFSRFQPQGYCIDQTGKIYSIPSSINDLFLLSDYGELFHSNAIIPSLTTIDGDSVLPFSVDWYYQSVDGEYLFAKRNRTVENHLFYEITGTIGLQFDPPPDVCSVSIYSNEQLIKECTLDELHTVSIDTGSQLTVDIQAEWAYSEELDYYGSIHYNFGVQIRNPSTFSIHSDTATEGEFLLISCTNISNPDRIRLLINSEEASPNFIWNGTIARAILPIPSSTSLKELNLQLSYGASRQEFKVTLEKAKKSSLTKLDWGETLRLNSHQALEHLLSSLPSSQNAPFYFRGNFLDPTTEGFSIEYTHGTEILYGTTLKQVISYGTEFVTDQTTATRVRALQNGTVIHTGFDKSLGNFVILEHGGGLRTVYGALSSISVEVGESIQKGDTIGKTSTNTRSGKNGFLVLCAIDSTLIDPACILGKNLSFPD